MHNFALFLQDSFYGSEERASNTSSSGKRFSHPSLIEFCAKRTLPKQQRPFWIDVQIYWQDCQQRFMLVWRSHGREVQSIALFPHSSSYGREGGKSPYKRMAKHLPATEPKHKYRNPGIRRFYIHSFLTRPPAQIPLLRVLCASRGW